MENEEQNNFDLINDFNENDLDVLTELDNLEKMLEQEEQKIELEHKEQNEKENIDVEEDSSITSVDRFDGIPDKLKPNLNIKCVTCQFAKWFGNNKVLKCYCREMFSIIYDSENTQDAVIYCENAHKEN